MESSEAQAELLSLAFLLLLSPTLFSRWTASEAQIRFSFHPALTGVQQPHPIKLHLPVSVGVPRKSSITACAVPGISSMIGLCPTEATSLFAGCCNTGDSDLIALLFGALFTTFSPLLLLLFSRSLVKFCVCGNFPGESLIFGTLLTRVTSPPPGCCNTHGSGHLSCLVCVAHAISPFLILFSSADSSVGLSL